MKIEPALQGNHGLRMTISGDTQEELLALNQWLDENIGDRYKRVLGPASIPHWWITQILFYEKSDAVMFKLAWAGRSQ